MKKQVCSSLLALTMTLGMVTPALAAQTEANVQSAACTCTAACTEETRNMDCAMCGAEGAPLTDCAQVNAQDDTNNEQQTANAENGFEYTVTGDEATITGYTGSAESPCHPVGAGRQAGHGDWSDGFFVLQQPDESNDSGRCDEHWRVCFFVLQQPDGSDDSKECDEHGR